MPTSEPPDTRVRHASAEGRAQNLFSLGPNGTLGDVRRATLTS